VVKEEMKLGMRVTVLDKNRYGRHSTVLLKELASHDLDSIPTLVALMHYLT